MLKVAISKVTVFNKKYNVFLDSENKFDFSNKREAEDFVRFVSAELNQALVFLNEEYVELERFYRTYFFAIADFKFKQNVENSLEYLRNRINRSLLQPDTENKNTIVYRGIEGCFLELLSVYEVLDQKAVVRRDFVTKQRIQNRHKIVELMAVDFKRFGLKIHVQKSDIQIYEDVKLRVV